jgi:outer membrane lipoprotein-sorting protein
MRLSASILLGLALTTLLLPGPTRPALAAPPIAPKSSVKPDVAALLKQSTDVYKKMKSYRHTALFVVEGKNPTTGAAVKQETRYTLALERPNLFAYKNDSRPLSAAVSDGKTFVNFRGGETLQYTRQKAPADFKGINIVDDVVFEPLATYVIALMLQGDALADKDVRDAMEKAVLKPATVTENGKKWQVLSVPFGQQDPTDFYFNTEDHLIGKAVQKIAQFNVKVTETFENVSINKPLDAAVFQYTPPEKASRIEKFLPTQKPNDARNRPRRLPTPLRS